MVADRRRRRRRPRRRQHLRVHRGGPRRSRSTRSWRSTSSARTAPGSSSPGAWPSATATSWPRRCPRSTRSPGSACRSRRAPPSGRRRLIPVQAVELPVARPAQPAPAGGDRAVGVRQDRRGLRPHLRVLRDPVVPRPAAQPRPSSRSCARSTQLGARRSCSSPRTSPSYGKDVPDELGAGSIVAAGARPSRERADWVRLLYLYPSDLTDELIDAICDTGVPYFDLSLQHVSKPLLRRMRRWGDGDRFLRRIDDIRAARARRRVPQQLHRRLPGRDRGATTTSCCASSRRPSSTGAASSPTAREDGHVRRRSRRRGRAGARSHERLAELRELQDDITARRRDALIGRDVEVLVDEPGVGRRIARRRRSTASIDVPA